MPDLTSKHLVLPPLGAQWISVPPQAGEAAAFTHAELPLRLATTTLDDRFATPAPAPTARVTDLVSTAGWPVQLVEHESRLELRFAVLELGGSVILTGPGATISAHLDALLATALAARPDFGSEPVCIAHLFEGLP